MARKFRVVPAKPNRSSPLMAKVPANLPIGLIVVVALGVLGLNIGDR
jgi:hypothetical protein